jgi:hypothetical protein
MATALDRDLVRLQCYEGLDESKALYEWNYQKQLLSIQVNMGSRDSEELTRSLFSDAYLLERPLLQSIRSEKPVVLLIDEIDRADEEFEAFLLELLSEMQVTIPEVGTIRAKSVPFVVLTSNRARPLSEALRRRCAYLYIPYPDMDKELAILKAKLPHVDDQLCAQVALTVQKLRSNEAILKKPSIAETLDWAAALDALGVRELTPDVLRRTAGFVLKNTLSENGGVTRGVCQVDAQGYLTDVVETKNIVKTPDGAQSDGEALDPNSYVSMNMWALQPEFVQMLDRGFREFFSTAAKENPLKAEYYLPSVPDMLIREGKGEVRLLETPEKWYGVTYHEDLAAVQAAMAKMRAEGVYPEKLWD